MVKPDDDPGVMYAAPLEVAVSRSSAPWGPNKAINRGYA